jgi:hypothetical protein
MARSKTEYAYAAITLLIDIVTCNHMKKQAKPQKKPASKATRRIVRRIGGAKTKPKEKIRNKAKQVGLKLRRTGKRKAKSGVHKVEHDRVQGTVYSGPDFGAGVDENLYKVRKSQEEEPLREQKKEASETL